jgi:hypothetical protein
LLVRNNEHLSAEQEMVEDLLTIVHCFSSAVRLAQLSQETQRGPDGGRSEVFLGHTIALDPTLDQAGHFRRACGTRRYAFNWGLAKWQRMHRARKLGLKASRRQYIRRLRLSKLHARLANIRKDAAHKLTPDLTRRFETIVIEDLNVSGMAQNHSLAGAVLGAMRGGRIVIADRFYPSTQICWCCGCLTGPKGREGLSVERWVCSQCGAEHERDANAAINLRKPGLARPLVNARGHEASSGCVSIPASVVDEPRTETVLAIERI